MAFSDPIATSAPPFGTLVHTQAPATFFTYSASKLMPTNIWWENLLVGTGQQTVSTLPYIQKMLTNGMHISYASRTVAANNILLTSAVKNFSLEVQETVTGRSIDDYTDFGVNLTYSVSGGSMKLNLVRGMAYNSAIYTAATPVLNTVHAILSANGGATGGNVTGTKFKFALNNSQTWILYASSSITLNVGTSAVTGTAPYTGSLQLAVMTDSSQETVYDASASNVLTGGAIDAAYSGNTATMTFSWTANTGTPLVLALPHHQDMMSPSYTALTIRGMKGDMKGIKATSWTLSESLTTISWDSPNGIDPTKTGDIQTALTAEKGFTPDVTNLDGNNVAHGVDPYFTGKAVAKQARMALIAHQIGDTSARDSIVTNMKTTLSNWFGGTLQNDLKYDTRWHGVITENGAADQGADFGQGWYNDHHFHYGYWIYAAAVIARFDSAWATSNKTAVESLVRDICNPSPTDTYFPRFRFKDWYDGHSWASGIFEFADGRNQESTSEAINAWYGVYLWGLATSNAAVKDLGRLHLAQEIRAAKKYWHVYSPDTMYDAPFDNHATVGVLWSDKVEYATFFGANNEYIHGIQVIPVTPITEEYADSAWVTRAYTEASSAMPTNTGWESIIYAMHAVIAPTAAYTELQTADLDDGATRTNSLYWGATRTASSGATSTSTTLSANPSSSAAQGATVTLTATISPSGATGSVTFKDGATTIGTGTVSGGTASTTTSSLSLGAHTLTAVFASSDTNTYANSTSSGLSYSITSGSTGTSTNASGAPFIALASGQPNVAVRATVADANYTVLASDSVVAYTSLSASRTVTLPAASGVQAGKQFVVKDESGSCASGKTITVAGTIDGTTNLVLNTAYAKTVLYSSGTAWFTIAS